MNFSLWQGLCSVKGKTFKTYCLMKTIYKLLSVILAITVSASTALAQQGGRRNGTVTARQETKAEKKQEKVDKVQTPANVSSQGATDIKLRATPETQGARRNGNDNRSSGNSGYSGNSGNVGMNSGSAGRNNGNAGNGNVNNGANRPPANNGNVYNGGNNRPPANNGGVHHGGGSYIPGYNNAYPGNRPPLPVVRNYTRTEVIERTNAAGIVVNTLFSSKMEAYYYIANLLDERYYTLSSYGNNYNWIRTEVNFIPTPFDWANPMTHNQFQMYFKITNSFGRIKVTITAQWRESVLSNKFSILRYQPSNTYSTYYAWNVLEDIADNIPNTGIYYRTADLL